jgi:hypothetical protein
MGLIGKMPAGISPLKACAFKADEEIDRDGAPRPHAAASKRIDDNKSVA